MKAHPVGKPYPKQDDPKRSAKQLSQRQLRRIYEAAVEAKKRRTRAELEKPQATDAQPHT